MSVGERKRLLIPLLLVLVQAANCQDLELPYFNDTAVIIRCAGFTVKYNETYEQAEWVAYQLTDDEVDSEEFDRTNDFREDPRVLTGTASLKDHAGSGYDRGHLVPADDLEWSETAMSESFLMINISPQEPGFNRGIWKKLENRVRKMAIENEEVYVVAGPVLTDGPFESIGPNEIAVPKRFSK